MAVIPFAKSLYLCESTFGYHDGKVDLYNLFQAIRPPAGYPYLHESFCVFSQLTGGLGNVNFFIDITHAATDELIYTSSTRTLRFSHRHKIVMMSVTMERCRFPKPGPYRVDLQCENQWVCDTMLMLQE